MVSVGCCLLLEKLYGEMYHAIMTTSLYTLQSLSITLINNIQGPQANDHWWGPGGSVDQDDGGVVEDCWQSNCHRIDCSSRVKNQLNVTNRYANCME